VGLNPERGDIITLRSMTFEPAPVLGTEATGAALPAIDLMQVIRLAVLAVVALILGLFVVRPILASGARSAALPAPVPLAPPALALDIMPAAATGPALTPALAAGAGPRSIADAATTVMDAEEVDPVTRLRRLISERQDETMQILQNWIDDPDQKERA
jgi:flagellar M-ring protein FliF